MMIEETFRELGFGERKMKLYMTLLERGAGTAARLAKAAGVKRTTAYEILNELCKEGLASQSFSGSRKLFAAEPPEELLAAAQRRLTLIGGVMPSLKSLYSHTGYHPKVRFYEGPDGIRTVYSELLQAKEYFYFGSMSSAIDVVGKDYLERFVKERVRKRIWANGIRIMEQETSLPFLLSGDRNFRRIRYLRFPDGRKAGDVANLTLYDRKMSICSTTKENFAIIIESTELFGILKLVWDCLWASASE
jgi:sugar-specific transcriptional regulator TrmB